MTAAWAWARAQLRGRLPMLVAAGILAGIAGVAAVSATAGAHRVATTYDRHLDVTRTAHVRIQPLEGELFGPGFMDEFLRTDGVETWSETVSLAMRPVGSDLYMLFDRWVMGALDQRFGYDVNRFRIVEGRAYDHRRDDEAVITTDYADLLGVGIGDVIRFETWTDDAVHEALVERGFAELPADGPTVDVEVVGIAREFESLLDSDAPGTVYLTEAFTRRWLGHIGVGPAVGLMRLTDGAEGFETFAAYARAVDERIDGRFVVDAMTARTASVDDGIEAQAMALVVFALVAGIAGMVVTYAAVARQLSFANADQLTLRTVGMTRAHRALGVVLVATPIAATAALVSVLGSIPASLLLPVGTPGRIEPEPGVHIDVLVLGVGAVGVAVVVLVISGAVAWSLTGQPQASATVATPGAGVVFARWFGGSAPVSIGVRTAIDRGQGERAIPARTTLVGCVVGVIGVTAALTFAASLHHLTVTPRLYGWSAEAWVAPEDDNGPDTLTALLHRLDDDPEIDELVGGVATGLVLNGQPVPAFVFDPRRGDPLNVMVSGRAPRSRDEVVLGEALADRLGVGRGDTVAVSLSDGSDAPYEVVGIAAHPSTGPNYREQAAVLGDSIDRFLVPDDYPWYFALVTFADGVDAERTIAAFVGEGLKALGEDPLPRSVAYLDEIELFPAVLALVLGVLAAVFLVHALAVGARRRAGELAILRALGFSRRQLRVVGLSQATTIAVVGLVIGLPLGVGMGRTAWAALAHSMGVVTEHRLPAWWGVWIVAVIVVANLLGLVASRRIISVKPAVELRAERG